MNRTRFDFTEIDLDFTEIDGIWKPPKIDLSPCTRC